MEPQQSTKELPLLAVPINFASSCLFDCLPSPADQLSPRADWAGIALDAQSPAGTAIAPSPQLGLLTRNLLAFLTPDPVGVNGSEHSLISDPLESVEIDPSANPDADLAGNLNDWEPDNSPPDGGGLAIPVPLIPPTIAVATVVVTTGNLPEEPSAPQQLQRGTVHGLVVDQPSLTPNDGTLAASTRNHLALVPSTPLTRNAEPATKKSQTSSSNDRSRSETILSLRLARTSSQPGTAVTGVNTIQDPEASPSGSPPRLESIHPTDSVNLPASFAITGPRNEPPLELDLATRVSSQSKQTASTPGENRSIGESEPQAGILRSQPPRDSTDSANAPPKDHQEQQGSRAEQRRPKSAHYDAKTPAVEPTLHRFDAPDFHNRSSAGEAKAPAPPVAKQVERPSESPVVTASSPLDRLLQQGRVVRELVLAIQDTPENAAQLRIVERRGQVEVTVSSATPEFRTAAVKDLPVLLERLEDTGYRAQQAHTDRTGGESNEPMRMGHLSSELQNFLDWQSRKDNREQRNQRNRNAVRRAPEEWQEVEETLAQAA